VAALWHVPELYNKIDKVCQDLSQHERVCRGDAVSGKEIKAAVQTLADLMCGEIRGPAA